MEPFIRSVIELYGCDPHVRASLTQLLQPDCGGYDAHKHAILFVLGAMGVPAHLNVTLRDSVLAQMRDGICELQRKSKHPWAPTVTAHLDVVDLAACTSIAQPTPPLTAEALDAIGGSKLVCMVDEYTRVRSLLPAAPHLPHAIGIPTQRTYVASHGDNVHTIAQHFLCSINDIRRLNPATLAVAESRFIEAGTRIKVLDYRSCLV